MNLWFSLAAFLLVLLAAILYSFAARRPHISHTAHRFDEALHRQGVRFDRKLYRQLSSREWLHYYLERLSKSEIDEMKKLLTQAGWGGRQRRFYYLLAAWLLPVGMSLAVLLHALLNAKGLFDILVSMLFTFALFFIGTRRLLSWKAAKRRALLRKETITFLHLLRMLFDAGLSLEHTLHVAVQKADELIPNLAQELLQALNRIKAGQDRGEALTEMAAPLEVPELNDTIVILKQATRYGGNIQEPLIEYTKLAEQRQVSELREYVSKLSAKMTMVMVLFLFPALLIFVAGPGFMGLAKALKGVGG